MNLYSVIYITLESVTRESFFLTSPLSLSLSLSLSLPPTFFTSSSSSF